MATDSGLFQNQKWVKFNDFETKYKKKRDREQYSSIALVFAVQRRVEPQGVGAYVPSKYDPLKFEIVCFCHCTDEKAVREAQGADAKTPPCIKSAPYFNFKNANQE